MVVRVEVDFGLRHKESMHRESMHRESMHRESMHRESMHRESMHREYRIAAGELCADDFGVI
jgi:hypothetical protein